MKQFICTNTFTSQKGEYYAKGAKIYESEYYQLTSTDKANFAPVRSDLEEFEPPISKDERFEGLMQDGKWEMPPSDIVDDIEDVIESIRNDSGVSSDDTFDFGDGDGGGAGASEDF